MKRKLTLYQILGITCDNATNNDKMIQELSDLLENFPGAANQTRCFTHILNLVVKSVLKQFDSPKKKTRDSLQDDGANERLDEPEDIDDEELGPEDLNNQYNDNEEDDNIDGWIDERVELSQVEVDELEASVLPVRLVLTKVCILFHY
jgi:hypothetical protein